MQPLLQRACACGQHSHGAGQCESCRQKRQGLQRHSAGLTVNTPGDRYEQEAERLASAVMQGSGGTGLPGRAGLRLQRQETPGGGKPPSEEEKYKEAAKKVGEAFLETEPGKKIKEGAKEAGEAFLGTLHGKIITGAAAVGAISYLAAANAELPMQVPEIPLDVVTPGLSMQLTYEGPVRKPTKAMISFTYKFGGGEKKAKPAMTAAEKRRAETAKLQKELYEFREGLKSPEQRAAEEKAFWDAYWRMRGKDPLNPLNLPGLEPKKKEEEGRSLLMMRKEASTGGPAYATPLVGEVLHESGQPLDPGSRAFMEGRFGYDFSHVRLHTGDRAAESARQVNALAYTVGSQVVFGAGQFNPTSEPGRRLLAHELAHVVQQTGGLPAASLPAPHLARQEAGPHPGEAAQPPGETEARPAEMEAGETGSATGTGCAGEGVNCNPRGLSRRDYLRQSGTSQDDFGLTRLTSAQITTPQLNFTRVGRRVALQPTTAAITNIFSVYTRAGTFIEGTIRVHGQEGSECPGGTYPVRWMITSQGAAKIRQGEQEHCDDFNHAFSLTLGRYRDEINRLASSGRTFASEAAARRVLQARVGFSFNDISSIFQCLAGKSLLRDSPRNQWHTPRPHRSPPMLVGRCREARATIGENSLPHVGRHPTADLIRGCGEAPAVPPRRGTGRRRG